MPSNGVLKWPAIPPNALRRHNSNLLLCAITAPILYHAVPAFLWKGSLGHKGCSKAICLSLDIILVSAFFPFRSIFLESQCFIGPSRCIKLSGH